ncbi:hypothetical protein [Lentzea sp. CA-135723]|uniref:hypothetical protein n=1 Tax=Lentzea sp. CA-135723 TaxID=3239950 RepID=UPI003D8B7114
MTSLTPAQRRRRLQDASQVLADGLRRVVGPEMTPERTQEVLTRAKATNPERVLQLAGFLAVHPAAFTAPPPDSPLLLVRLLSTLAEMGHGDAVTLPACAGCGHTGRHLRNTNAEGARVCGGCYTRLNARPCDRCGVVRRTAARRPDGRICQSCRKQDPDYQRECAGCGRLRPPNARRADGSVLCQTCTTRPRHVCCRCGEQRPAQALTDDGPVCRLCHQQPHRRCGLCGEVDLIVVRAADGNPDICQRCYRNEDECVVCGRVRDGSRLHGGPFHCQSCRPRSQRACALCGTTARITANWPLGAVCTPCYDHHTHHPRPCPGCGTTRVLVGRDDTGIVVCGPCVGSGLTYSCRRCGASGEIHKNRLCARCLAADQVHALLTTSEGTVHAQLRPLIEALTAVPRAAAVLQWLRTSPAAPLLGELAAGGAEITHELVDRLPRDRNTASARRMLVAAGVLPDRNEPFAQLRLWSKEELAGLPAHHQAAVRPFIEWKVLRDARRRADRGRYTDGAASGDRADVRAAIELMRWLDTHDLTLSTFTQGHLDTWLDGNRNRLHKSNLFLRWVIDRRLTDRLEIPSILRSRPTRFLDGDEHTAQLRRCLTDETLPLPVRISAALTRLYGLHNGRITELTTDRFHRDDDGAYLTIDRNPVLLPPSLARLIERQIAEPDHLSLLDRALEPETRYLLPGRHPGRPRTANGLTRLLNRYGFPVASARNTAMIEMVAELPPTIISDLFGIHPSTTHAWANYAQDSWADYLAAQDKTTSPAGTQPS